MSGMGDGIGIDEYRGVIDFIEYTRKYGFYNAIKEDKFLFVDRCLTGLIKILGGEDFISERDISKSLKRIN